MSDDPEKNAVGSASEAPTQKGKSGKKDKSSRIDTISKFKGEGVSYKAKLYGSVYVNEARGDSMCQKALQQLKTTIKVNSQHKQKILIKINIEGVVIVEAATNQRLMEHKVDKISFISKDCNDNRSFSYVVGTNDGKHILYGLKTDKPSEAVMLSFRDLFQVVYQLKETSENRVSQSSRHSVGSNAEASNAEGSNAEAASVSTPNCVSPSMKGDDMPTHTRTLSSSESADTTLVIKSVTDVNWEQMTEVFKDIQDTKVEASDAVTASDSAGVSILPVDDDNNHTDLFSIHNLPGDSSNTDSDAAALKDNQTVEVIQSCQVVENKQLNADTFEDRPTDVFQSSSSFTDEKLVENPSIAHNCEKSQSEAQGATVFSTTFSQDRSEEIPKCKETSVEVRMMQQNLSELAVADDTPVAVGHSELAVTDNQAKVAKPAPQTFKDVNNFAKEFVWEKGAKVEDPFSSSDPFSTNNDGNISKVDVNPWSTEEAITTTDPWASFDKADHWTSTGAEECPWNATDPWAASPFTLTTESSKDVDAEGLEAQFATKSVPVESNIGQSAVNDEVNLAHSIDHTDKETVNEDSIREQIGLQINPNELKLTTADEEKTIVAEKHIDLDQEPFANNVSFFEQDPFSSDMMADTKTFPVDDSIVFEKDPFSDIDPFASATPSAASLNVIDSDPFAASVDLFTDFPKQADKSGLNETNILLPAVSAANADDLVVTSAVSCEVDSRIPADNATIAGSDESLLSGMSAVVGAEPFETRSTAFEDEESIEQTDTSIKSDSYDHLSFAPPSCPPPNLPPEILASIEGNTTATSVSLPKQPAPPAVPARRSTSSSETQISAVPLTPPPTSLPPAIPSRNLDRKLSFNQHELVDDIESKPPSSPAPTLPSLGKPPLIPHRSISTEAPKIPARKFPVKSENDKKSLPLTLPPSVTSTDI